MYSNDLTQIRTGLVNYIGAMLKATKLEGKAANQTVAATLVEEALKLTQVESSVCDLYVAKPILRANIFLLNQRCSELKKLMSTLDGEVKITVATKIKRYEEIVLEYETMLKDV